MIGQCSRNGGGRDGSSISNSFWVSKNDSLGHVPQSQCIDLRIVPCVPILLPAAVVTDLGALATEVLR